MWLTDKDRKLKKEYEELLNLPEKYTLYEVDHHYKEMVKKNHPDVGGDPEIMILLNNARDFYESLFMGVKDRTIFREGATRSQDRKNNEAKDSASNEKGEGVWADVQSKSTENRKAKRRVRKYQPVDLREEKVSDLTADELRHRYAPEKKKSFSLLFSLFCRVLLLLACLGFFTYVFSIFMPNNPDFYPSEMVWLAEGVGLAGIVNLFTGCFTDPLIRSFWSLIWGIAGVLNSR